jgi:release factor glutamine methyltransferase
MTVRSLLDQARSELDSWDTGRLDAEVLLCHVLGTTRAWLYANSEEPVDPAKTRHFRQLVSRRVCGEPVAYLTGTREFWSLALKVTPDVLIPRPETELLVETALEFIPEGVRWRVADLGTGSGAIALALAKERPECEIFATDISEKALAVALANARNLNLSRVRFVQGSWLAPLRGRFNGLVSNPPYVPEDDPHLTTGDCRHEPRTALTPGPDGIGSIREIAREALNVLESGGFLAFEHGHDQGAASRALLRELGYRGIESRQDLAGLERVTSGFAP